ncbi:MAG: tRNA1(Val) (adenine(37)-N6)-methyltransferase [Bacillota bacterium]
MMNNQSEKIEPLYVNGLKIIQRHDLPCFSADALLLADFAPAKSGDQIVDLCCGTGVIPLLLSAKAENSHIYGVEIMPFLADMAKRSVELNHLEQQITILEGDLCQASALLGQSLFDLVTANPPYNKKSTCRISPDPYFSAARSEIFCSLEDVIRESAALLKAGGSLAMVQKTERLQETYELCHKYDLYPRLLRLVQSLPGKEPHIFLLQARKSQPCTLRKLPILLTHRSPGIYTREAEMILGGGK